MIIFYLSNAIMSLIVQLSTILIIIAFSVTFPVKKKAMKFGAGLMLLANVLGQLVIAGEGPAFALGLVVFPFWGALVAYVTVIIKQRKLKKIKGQAF